MDPHTLAQYRSLVEFLGLVLGPDYEITLHDLKDSDRSLAAIANGQISGRAVGAPLTDKALRFLADKIYLQSDYKVNYTGQSITGKALRSATFFIKNDMGEPVGMLCINFDDSRFRDVSARLLELCHPQGFFNQMTLKKADDPEEGEMLLGSIHAVVENVVSRAVAQTAVPVERLTQEEKMEIIAALNERGVFLLKGAVSNVAQALHSSEASIYRYLSKLPQK